MLVGTTSIEKKSETASNLLKKKKVPHAVLNARFHEQEAEIVSQAGAPGAVTIATNMAGRGTDIKLGGNLDVRLREELSDIHDETQRAARQTDVRREIARHDREHPAHRVHLSRRGHDAIVDQPHDCVACAAHPGRAVADIRGAGAILREPRRPLDRVVGVDIATGPGAIIATPQSRQPCGTRGSRMTGAPFSTGNVWSPTGVSSVASWRMGAGSINSPTAR